MKVLTENARRITKIIIEEHGLQAQRAKAGFIPEERVMACLYERLHRLAVKDLSLRKFLDDSGFIHFREDEDTTLEWAADPRFSEEEEERKQAVG